MVPKLADFGLAKILEMEETKVFTDVRGTIGYMDPEYITHSKLTCASDIYSFGVVTLQLLSGRKVIELDIVARDSLTKKVNMIFYSSDDICAKLVEMIQQLQKQQLFFSSFFMFTGQGLVMFISWYFMIHCIINTFPISVKYLTILTFSFFYLKAKDVVSGKKPLEEFIDPRVRDDVIIEDFVLILKIAVLCVASSSVGRPTIKDVLEEMDKALRNTTIKVQILLSIA
jgi:serine/threonine protein kinase